MPKRKSSKLKIGLLILIALFAIVTVVARRYMDDRKRLTKLEAESPAIVLLREAEQALKSSDSAKAAEKASAAQVLFEAEQANDPKTRAALRSVLNTQFLALKNLNRIAEAMEVAQKRLLLAREDFLAAPLDADLERNYLALAMELSVFQRETQKFAQVPPCKLAADEVAETEKSLALDPQVRSDLSQAYLEAASHYDIEHAAAALPLLDRAVELAVAAPDDPVSVMRLEATLLRAMSQAERVNLPDADRFGRKALDLMIVQSSLAPEDRALDARRADLLLHLADKAAQNKNADSVKISEDYAAALSVRRNLYTVRAIQAPELAQLMLKFAIWQGPSGRDLMAEAVELVDKFVTDRNCKEKDKLLAVEILGRYATLLRDTPQNALPHAKRAYELATALPNSHALARATAAIRLARLYRDLKRSVEMRELVERERPILESAPDSPRKRTLLSILNKPTL